MVISKEGEEKGVDNEFLILGLLPLNRSVQ